MIVSKEYETMNETNLMNKMEIRKIIRDKKKTLSQEFIKEAEASCYERLIHIDLWQQADTIFTYVSYKEEMGTHLLIKKAFEEGKKVAVPRVEGDVMQFYYFSSMDKLVRSKMGILEPVPIRSEQQGLDNTSWNNRNLNQGINLAIDENALFIMPGVAFDMKHDRIGYGGGYYDKYLTAHPHINKIALAYDFQIMEEVPSEKHDIKPDMILTETRII